MTETRIIEGIQDPATWSLGSEPDQSFCETAHPNDRVWQGLPDYIASGPPLLDHASRFLGDNWSFDKIVIPDYNISLAFVVLPDAIPGQFRSVDHPCNFGDVYNAVRNLYIERVEQIYFPTRENSTTPPAALGTHRFFFSDTFETPSYQENPLLLPVREFALGLDGIQPDDTVVGMAARIVRAVHDFTIGPHITVDDEGGELDLHLRLADGLLVMANLFPDGTIDASVYDDSHGVPVKVVKRMRRSTTSEGELTTLLQAGMHVGTT